MGGNDTNDGGVGIKAVGPKKIFSSLLLLLLVLSLPDYAEELRFYLIHMTEVSGETISLSVSVKAKQGERTEG